MTKEKNRLVKSFEAILTQPTPQDYIDLYIILKRKHYTLSQLRKWHYQKIPIDIEPLDIAAAFLKANEITQFPKMKVPFSRPKMIAFFESLAKSLEPEIFK